MAATDKVEAVLVHGEAGHGVQVGHLNKELKSSLKGMINKLNG